MQAITDDASSPDIFKTAPPWYPAIPDYVNRTFQYGHAIDAGVKLFYNDYGAGGCRAGRGRAVCCPAAAALALCRHPCLAACVHAGAGVQRAPA